MRQFKHVKAIITFLVVGILVAAGSAPVFADTTPPSGTPSTVSDDALPTAQIDGTNGGIVWDQAIVGNTVYATGNFSSARPAGVPKGGAGTVTRTNLLAYNITNGVLTSFSHSLNGEGRVIKASPDGKRLIVGGAFTTVDGQPRSHIAALDTTTGLLVPGFGVNGPNGTVKTIVPTNTGVYFGGTFSKVGTSIRSNAAQLSSTGGLTAWAPKANSSVQAMVLTPDGSKMVLGGTFLTLNGAKYYGSGAVTAGGAGTNVAWASQSATYPIQSVDLNGGYGASITSLSTDGKQIYVTAFSYLSGSQPRALEGRAAISVTNGNVIWVNNCYGDTYDAVPVGNVLYSVGHAHDCSAIGAYPQNKDHNAAQRALAETTYATGRNGTSTSYPNRTSYAGYPDSTQLDWYPDLAQGTASGADQAAWTIESNGTYLVLGGEFPKVNGQAQQGLTRFAIKSIAPNKIGPRAFVAPGIKAGTVSTLGHATIVMNTTWDPDNAVLTYKLYRDHGTTPISMFTADTRFWHLPTHTFSDSGLTYGTTHTYQLVATDPFGNSAATGWVAN